VNQLLEQVAAAIQSRRLFRARQRLLVAVSGGVDSMVLLNLLNELAARHGWRLVVAHLNHQLRGRNSDADERLVRRTAKKLGLPLVVERAAVRGFASAHKVSLEMAARAMRHEFLARTAARRRIPTVALAHHADDQLELFFLRLLRGSGGEALAGMQWRNPSPSDKSIELVRPLLGESKTALREYAAKQGIRFREDATNASLAMQRNRIRHELLPLLRRKYQPALEGVVLRLMAVVGAEARLVGDLARQWLLGQGWSTDCGRTGSRVRKRSGSSASGWEHGTAFQELPVAMQRRCLQLQLLSLGVAGDYELVERLRLEPNQPVSVSPRGAAFMPLQPVEPPGVAGPQPPQRVVLRDLAGRVRLQNAAITKFPAGRLQLDLEGKAGEAVFEGVRIRWRRVSAKAPGLPKAMPRREFFDTAKIGSPVVLRHWRAGDRFQPIGMAKPVKLQDFFTNQKVPRGRRHELIVAVAANGEVFWVEGLRIAERFKLTHETIRRLQWAWQRL
jgi:tRNA(Ile)-lysidine synthase